MFAEDEVVFLRRRVRELERQLAERQDQTAYAVHVQAMNASHPHLQLVWSVSR